MTVCTSDRGARSDQVQADDVASYLCLPLLRLYLFSCSLSEVSV